MTRAAWKSDPWRAVCPQGHSSWRRHHKNESGREYECDACGYFGELHDVKETGRQVV